VAKWRPVVLNAIARGWIMPRQAPPPDVPPMEKMEAPDWQRVANEICAS
jgi:hypothetical protein